MCRVMAVTIYICVQISERINMRGDGCDYPSRALNMSLSLRANVLTYACVCTNTHGYVHTVLPLGDSSRRCRCLGLHVQNPLHAGNVPWCCVPLPVHESSACICLSPSHLRVSVCPRIICVYLPVPESSACICVSPSHLRVSVCPRIIWLYLEAFHVKQISLSW
jgi:hypothetical protein